MTHDPIPAQPAAPQTGDDPLAGYVPVTLQRMRHDGWTADRQRRFLATLADTGSISAACEAAGVTARSAYRLRRHPAGAPFAKAWDNALYVATGTLTTLAYERAARGSIREYWKDGALIGETRQPSDGLLKWLLTHLAPEKFGRQGEFARTSSKVPAARAAFPGQLEMLADADVPADRLCAADFRAAPPEHGHDPLAPPVDLDADEAEAAWHDAWYAETP